MKLLVLVTLIAFCYCQELAEKRPVKRSYVCPPKFIRQGHRCYFFSRKPATWQEAHFHCRDMRSNIAIINNANQDKLIRTFLSKKTLAPLERWIGGVYDWEQMSWKWAASGKPLAYNGFPKQERENKEHTENLRWHCIIMDPALQYRWNSHSCVEQKHFICHTKMKVVGSRGKKKLQRQYNADKYNKLNEIPVPDIPDYNGNSTAQLKTNIPISYKLEINQSLNDQALFGYAPMDQKRRVRKNRRRRKKNRQLPLKRYANDKVVEEAKLKGYTNGTDAKVQKNRADRRFKGKDVNRGDLLNHIRWKTYKKDAKVNNPLYPRPIVEEYNYIKET